MDQAWRLTPLRQGVHRPYGSAAAGGVRERVVCEGDGVVLRGGGTWGGASATSGADGTATSAVVGATAVLCCLFVCLDVWKIMKIQRFFCI